MMISRRHAAVLAMLAATLGLLLFAALARFPLIPSRVAPLHEAWQQARASGRYDFHTEVVQRTSPLPVLENVGLSSHEERYYLMGALDLPARSLDLHLWSRDGSAATGAGGLAIKIEDGKAFGRTEMGDWQELDGDLSSAFAPGNDPLGFLVAARNVQPSGSEQRAGISYTRYTFDLNGPAFARYMRDHVEGELRRQGKLPPGAGLEVSRSYNDMTGTGELWVGDDGMPLRQVVRLAFPDPYRPQTVEATISTDFSGFSQPATGLLPRLALIDWRGAGAGALSVTLALSLVALLIAFQPSRRLYRAIALLTIASMLVTPLSQGAQIRAFAAETGARDAAARQEAEQARRREAYVAEQARSAFDPTRSPLEQSGAPAPALSLSSASTSFDDGTDSDHDGLSDVAEALLTTNPAKADSDGDGLSDGVEVRELDTEPLEADSDSDGLSDSFEVRGFVDGLGKQWYLDPTAYDTNRDGLLDTIECRIVSLSCPDTDADGKPDPFDGDNDDDGVPDRLDTAPNTFTGGARRKGKITGLDQGLLKFRVDKATPNEELFVDFQVRPANPAHLWYSLNVLDWPSNDREGQLRRVKDDTFGASGKDANGDLRLIPMLEIEIPYKEGTFGALPVRPGVTAMPPLPTLTGLAPGAYQTAVDGWFNQWLDNQKTASLGLAVRLKNTNRDLVVQAPLTLVRDPATETPVAFSARMLYRPGSAGFNAEHTARLAWVLQARQDTCATAPAADSAAAEAFNQKAWDAQPIATRGTYKSWKNKSESERYDTWCADSANWSTSEGAAITYYDDWYLTSLDVREDHSARVALVLQTAPYYAAQSGLPLLLWQLADQLDRTYLRGDKSITLDTILNNLDSRRNGSSTPATRMGFPQDAFFVNLEEFADQSELGRLAASINATRLNAAYVGAGGATSVAEPTMLFLREERYRQATLAMPAVTSQNQALTINLDQANIPIERSAALSWSPFRYKENQQWEVYPISQYWGKLKGSFSTVLQSLNLPAYQDPQMLAGAVELTRMQYMAYHTGLSTLLERDGRPAQVETPPESRPLELGDPVRALHERAKALVDAVASKEFKTSAARKGTAASAAASSGFAVLGLIGGLTTSGEKSDAVKSMINALSRMMALGVGKGKVWGGVTVGMQVAAVGVATFLSLELFGITDALGPASNALAYGATALEVLTTAKGVWDAVQKGRSLQSEGKIVSLLQGSISKASKSASIAAVVMLVIEVGIAVGLFIYQMVASGTKFGSLAFNQALAHLIATIAVAVFMTVLSLIVPIGTIIAAIIGLIDALIMGICKLTGADKSSNKIVKDYVCAGISGVLAKLFAFIFYSQNPFVELGADDRFNVSNWNLAPKDASGAQSQFQVGSYLEANVDAVTSLTRTKPNSLLTAAYFWEYLLDSNVTASTYRYAFTAAKETGSQQIHERLGLNTGSMHQSWKEKGSRFVATQRVSSGQLIRLTTPGINWRPTFFLAEGYAVLTHECALVPMGFVPIPVCWKRDKSDSTYMNMSQSFAFDIFPATLDEFYRLADRGNGSFALAWDSGFPALKDADGDGLRSRAFGGNDPNDNAADSDGDGLSDFYELQHAGAGFDPNRADTDGDGLSDSDEVRAGTRPALADSDNDGLGDNAEQTGWEIVYAYDELNNPLRFRVTSDPLSADADGDKIPDSREKIYGFHPRIPNDTNLLRVITAIDERDGIQDGIVSDNREIGYKARVVNNLRDRYAFGLLEVGIPTGASSISLAPRVYTLSPGASATLNGTLRIADLSTSEKVRLVNRAGAVIADLRARADGRVVWLHFDETASAYWFADDSTLGNAARCPGSACPESNQDGYMGRAIRFSGATPLEIPHRPSLGNLNRMTISLWVNPSASSSSGQALVTKEDGPGSRVNFNLALLGASNQVRLIAQKESCAANDNAVTLTSTGGLPAGQWNHIGALYDGARFAIYINGVLDKEANYSGKLCANSAPVRIGSGAAAGTLIDELSLYPRGLLPAELAQFFRDPLIDLRFEGSVSDSSSLRQQVRAYGGDFGAFLAERSGSKAASFNQTRWLDVSGTFNLGRGAGHFSVALWIKPQFTGGRWLGVFGREEGNRGFPSLYYTSSNKQVRLKLEFGNGSALCTSQPTNPLLTQDVWQHLLVVYNGTQFLFYRNGKLVQALPLSNCAPDSKPAPGHWFWIGRASPRARVSFTTLKVTHDGDGIGGAEYFIEFDGKQIWKKDAESGDKFDLSSLSRDILDDNQHRFRLVEDDSSSSDDVELDFSFNNYPRLYAESRYNDDGEGTLGWGVTNEFFSGALDMFQIYGYAMSEDEARAFYQSQTRALAISFDDPPGASTFADSSGDGNSAVCSGTTCPISGLAGRAGQAARFDGSNDAVVVTHNNSFQPSQGYSVAAWVRLDTTSGDQKIVSKYTDSGSLKAGYMLGVRNGKLFAEIWDVAGRLLKVEGGSIPAGTWTHVALVVTFAPGSSKNTLTLIGSVNGAEVGRAERSEANQPGPSSTVIPITIGRASGNWGWTAGMIDEVVFFTQPLSREQLASLIAAAPALSLSFDEPLGSASFANGASPGLNATCAPPRCPNAGYKGQIRDAIAFDSFDMLSIPDPGAATRKRFSLALWVNPGTNHVLNEQVLLSQGDNQPVLQLVQVSASSKLEARLRVGACQIPITLRSARELLIDMWNHVALTFDGANLRLYLNGTLDSTLAVSGALCPGSATLLIGGTSTLGTTLHGALDELTLSNDSLSANEIQAIYSYQNAWFDVAVATDLIIDADNPTVRLDVAATTRLPNRDVLLSVYARDGTSGITRVDVGAGRGWQQATRDGDAWVFVYTPLGAGDQVIMVRAFDSVGHSNTTTSHVWVDGVAPAVSIDPALSGQTLRAQPGGANLWTLTLSGSASDDRSGTARVLVRLLNADGATIGAPLSFEGVNGPWSGGYQLPFPPNGLYRVQARATDHTGNQAVAEAAIRVDSTPGMAEVTAGTTRIGGVGANLPILRGTAGDLPIPEGASLHLSFEEQSGATTFLDGSRFQLEGTCAGNACPAAGRVGRFGAALAFDGANDTIAIDLDPRRDGSGVEGLNPQPFTVAAWVHAGQVNGHTLFSAARDGAEALQVAVTNSGGRINAWGDLGGAWTALVQGDLEVDAWNHVAVSFDGTTFRAYVNGVQTYTSAPDSPAFRGFDHLWVGSHLGAGEYLAGEVDELLVYRGALSAEQIRRLVTTVSVPVSQVEVGLLHWKDRDTPSAIQWQPAALGQSSQTFVTWSVPLEEGIEGPYQIWLRTADALGNQITLPNVWSGNLDTFAPRASFAYSPVAGGAARVSCAASDYNLDQQAFDCPVPRSDRWSFGYQAADWFLAMLRAPDTLGAIRPAPQKLESIDTGILTVTGAATSMRACDSFGNCTTLVHEPQAAPELQLQAAIQAAPELQIAIQTTLGASLVITPALPQVFTDLNPIPLGGYARAEDGLQSLDVSVGGGSIYTERWTNNEVEDTWSALYTPTAEGIHAVEATLLDRNNTVITDTARPRLYVDLTPPQVTLSTSGFGPNDTLPGGFLIVSGLLTESVALQRLEVRFGDEPWQELGLPAMPAAATPFSATLSSGLSGPFSGERFTVTARATDIAGRSVEVSRTLTADNTAPTLGALSLEYQRAATPVAILPGATVSDEPDPELSIRWAPADDSSGIARYLAGWTDSPTPVLAELTEHPSSDSIHTRRFGDVRRLWAHLVAEDLLGNRSVQTLGPIYVDHGLTPAYIEMDEFGLPYRGHTTDSCSQIGLDNRLSWQGQGDTSQSQPQQLYLTWNANGLRLTWTGANWDTEGDLFIYLDTRPGAGSNQAYDPFPATSANTTMLLPRRDGNPMGADFLVWVQDSRSASLLRWDGAAWQAAAGAWSIVVDPNMAAPHTDLFLPFATLEIDDPSANALLLLALASEEGQLRTWATMPPANSLTSERIVSRGTMPAQLTLRLRNAYFWAGLGDGVCPRGLDARVASAPGPRIAGASLRGASIASVPGASVQTSQPLQFSGADVSVRLSADFPGLISGFFGDNLFFLGEDAGASASGLSTDKNLALPSLGDGDVVTYTLSFANRGSGPSSGLTFLIRSSGSLRLVGGSGDELLLSAGELPAGASGSLSFQARMEKASLPPDTFRWDSLNVVTYDASGTPDEGWIDQITAEHQVDDEPPRHIEITQPVAVIGTGQTTFRGVVADYSAVPAIDLEVRDGPSTACIDPAPLDHSWECAIEVHAADGAVVEARARATDEHGQTGEWSDWQAFVVDTSAPSVSFDAGTESALADGLIGPGEATLSGVIGDNRLPAAVFVCDPDDDTCEAATLVLDSAASAPLTVVDRPATPLALDSIPACGVDALRRDLVVDADLTVADANLGLSISGVQHGQIQVALTSPTGTPATLIASRVGGKGQHYNVTLDDAVYLLERDDTSDHGFERPFAASAAPYPDKLTLFNDEPARGIWQLAICNGSGGAISGAYIAASLILTPRATPADTSARWSYTLPIPEGSASLARRLRIYGADSAGNTSQASSIERALRLDNVAPALNIAEVQLGEDGLLELAGESRDSSQIVALRLTLRTPAGDTIGATIGVEDRATRSVATTPWRYVAAEPLGPSGLYKLWVEAEDAAGNTTIVAAGDLNWINPARSGGGRVYLPLVRR